MYYVKNVIFVLLFFQDMEDGFKDLISTFLWPDIGKLTFDVSVDNFIMGLLIEFC